MYGEKFFAKKAISLLCPRSISPRAFEVYIKLYILLMSCLVSSWMIAEIAAQTERYAIRLEQADGLHLRKANRIKTIHSSLVIEGNTLSEDEVRDIINVR